MKKVSFLKVFTVLVLCLNLAVPPGLMAQGDKGETTTEGEGAPAFRPEEIDQLVAPIALYPDSLLAQLLVASTYPLEIVQAARFVQQNKELKGEKLMAAAKDKDWEPSVKAMLEFPDVLRMMDEKIELTEKLGDAFLAQQRDVMDSVQRLRRKAEESGNLKTTKEQKVIVEEETKVVVIEPANPDVVYVPTYNPAVVYGGWPYPAYPPYSYYPPGYVAGGALLSFGVGVAIGAAWGGWGCGWGHNEININSNRQNNFTRNNYNHPEKYQNKGNKWQHNPEHRKGASYKNQATAQKYGQQRSGSGARPTSSNYKGYDRGAGAGGAGRAQTSDVSRGGGRDNAFSGSDRGGSERAASNRGQQSLGSSSRSGSGASRSSGGASRGGGGASRGGGGGGGRGGGRR
jgi:hypothetical protein